MSVINTNVKALYTQAAMKISGREGTEAMQQLSTGKRINSAKDDAAGMAIADRMTQQIRSLNMAVRNAGDAISLIQTAEGATSEITDMLQRMRELSIQAMNDTNTGEQRGYLDLEFQQLKQEIVRISDTTEWNGYPLLNGTNGVAQGEQPVYKVQSTPETVTAPVAAGTDKAITEPIEQQLMSFTDAAKQIMPVTFADATATGAVSVTMDDSVDVTFWVTAGDTAAEVAAKAVTALNNDSTFVALSRLAVDEGLGTVNIVMARADAGTDKNVTFSDLTTDAAASGVITTGYLLNTRVQMDTVTFTQGTTAGALELTVDSLIDVYVQVDAADTAFTMATKAKAALEANASFVSSGRTAVVNSNNDLEINYTAADGTVTVASAAATTYAGSSLGTATGGGNITVGGVTVAVTAGDTKETIAASVATAMSAATFVTSNDGRHHVCRYGLNRHHSNGGDPVCSQYDQHVCQFGCI